MNEVFRAIQKNGNSFRSQLFKTGVNGGMVLWLAESKEEVYHLEFDQVFAAEIYTISANDDAHQIILLLRNTSEEEIQSQEVGYFSMEDAQNFLQWFKHWVKVLKFQ
jgi:hypothetical protein